MVRETRHLWVGNLPENIREDRIREHFKRYGRVQSVKLLPRLKEEDGPTGLCATVAFMDIKSASKAHNAEHKLDERCLSTEYYEPAAIPGGSAAPLYVAPRFPHGPPEDHATFERSSHFYERREGDAYLRRQASAYHVTDPLRGRTRDRLYRNGPYTPLIDRTQPTHHRPLGNAWSYDGTTSGRYPTTTPTPDPYPEERRETQPVVHKKRPKSRSGSESGSNSGSSRSRSRSRSRSHSSSSSSQSGSSSCSSGTSSPGTDKSCSPHSSSHHGTARSGRVGGVALQSAVSAPHANNVSPAVQSEDRRSLAICVRNLPVRSSDTSLKDGLFHEYKKHGKVTCVKVVGQAGDRYALVCFKKPDDVEKALEESHNKLFFGCKIEVAPYQGYDVDDNEFRPYEAELDEFHPKATRTLFIGNLEKEVTATELRKHFDQFGEIIEIDIKKQGVVSSYAFCQYADIASVVKAMRTMDGEHLGNNRIKLGFGKSMATNCVWVDGIADTVSDKYLNLQFSQFGNVTHVTVDRERGHALIYFEQIPCAQDAVREMRGVLLRNRKLQVDFASRECQEAFYEHLEKQGHAVGAERPWERYDSNSREVQAGRFETTVVVPGARFTRYEAQPRPRAASYNRTANCSTSTPVPAAVGTTVGQGRAGARTQRTGQRYEYYDTEYPDRRYRNYDEFSQGSAASHDDSYEQELRDYGYCQRERGDSSPSPGACESETSSVRRSVAVVTARPAKSCSPGDKAPCSEDDPAYKRHSLQSVVVSSDVGAPSQLPPPPSSVQHPLDIRHLQKERVHIQNLLEQLESSGDDDGGMSSSAPKKRLKLASDDCGEPPPSLPMCAVGPGGIDMCYENHGDVGAPSLVVTTHNHRKSVSEVRRLSDVSGKHCSRRLSTDSTSKHGGGGRDVRETSADRLVSVQSYSPHPVCKRRKTGSSTSESEDRVSCRSGKHSHHHHHHQHGEPASSTLTVSGGESVDGSRPGTPLCDERPENLLPPTEPRRFPRDRLATEGPLSLPLPRFAAQVLSSTPRLSVSVSGMTPSTSKAPPVSSPPAAITSPRPAPSHSQPIIHQPPPSPIPAPPPASPPPRPASLPSSSSSDSELSPPSPTLEEIEERIRSLDEKYEKWSGSRALSAAGGDALAKLDASASERFRFRHKLLDLDLNELQPSDIVKSVLAKRSVFDEDSKRLENFSDKYEPREFIPYTRTPGCFQGLRIKTECMREFPCSTPTKPVAPATPVAGTPGASGITGKVGSFPNPSTPQLPSRLMGTPSPLHSPSHPLPKSPYSAGTPTTPTPLKSHISLSPVGITPLHPQCGPKLQQQQSVPKTPSTGLPAAAKGLQYPFPSHPPVLPTTTVATTTATTIAALVSVSSVGVKPSLSVTVPTSATGPVLSPEVTRTCVAKPVGQLTNTTPYSTEVSRSSVLRPSVTVLTTATGTKPTPEVMSRVPLKLISSAPTPSSTVSGRVPSPGVLRLPTCVKPSTSTVTSTTVSMVVAPETMRTSTISVKSSSGTVMSSPEVTRFQPSVTYTSTRVSSTVIPSQPTPKVSSTMASSAPAALRVSTTTTKTGSNVPLPTTTVVMSTSSSLQTSPSKSSKLVEQSPKIIKEHSPVLVRTDTPQSSNIPSVKSPNEMAIASSCSPRVVIVPVSVTNGCAPTVTTVVASSTATTTVLTMTMASTVATSTTFTTSMSTPTTNSSSETTKSNLKSKQCTTTKKEQPSQSQPPPKDKQCDTSKQSSNVKKESLLSLAGSSVNSTKKDKDGTTRDQDVKNSTSSAHKSKTAGHMEEKRDRKENAASICIRRDSEKDGEPGDRQRERSESTEKDKRKDRDSVECIERDRRKDSHSTDTEKERRKDSVDSLEKERRKEECTDSLDRRKEFVESSDKDRWKDGHIENVDKNKWKDRDENLDKDRRKENHMAEKEFESVVDIEKRMENSEKRSKERKKERGSSSGSPASIGCKRRVSSQDSVDSVPDDAKRLKLEHRKIAERRDSKDSGRSSSSSKRSSSERPRSHGSASANTDTKSFAKLLEDKIREDNKRQQSKDDPDRKKDVKLQESCDKHKPKDKQKKKSKSDRDSPKEVREFSIKSTKDPTLDKELSPKSNKKKDDSDAEDKDESKHKHAKRELKEKKKQMKDEFGSSEFLDDKGRAAKKDRDKRNSSERRKEENANKEDQKFMAQKKEGKPQKKEFSNSDSDSEDGSGDGPKKHSIFDIVDDGPAYISMYDKVKARSTKNMQKQEEERRQEMMREKFDLLKKKRAKREEKKRSTSWDEDSDSDNEHGSKCKRHVKQLISSSDDDDGRSRYEGDEPKLNKSRPVVRIKKEDICTGKSDSDSDILGRSGRDVRRTAGKQDGSEDDDNSIRTKHLTAVGKKGNRSKLVSDTSEDDNTMARFKSNAHKMSDTYSADSDADQGFADSDEKLPTSKKSSMKNNRMGKNVLDSSNDESSKKLISDLTKTSTDKQISLKKAGNKNKFNKNMPDSSDEEYNRKFICEMEKNDDYSDEKLASLKKSFVKNRVAKDSLDSSDDESSRKLSDVLKGDLYGNDKQSSIKKTNVKNKSKIPVDSSDDENVKKLSTVPKSDIFGEEKQALFRKSVLKNKTAKSFSDISVEETTKKFLSDTEKTDIFGDSVQVEKCTSTQLKTTIALSNSSDCEANASTPPPQLDKKPSFHGNSIDKGTEITRKKSHKKKQKRQKNSQSSEDGLVKMVSTDSDLAMDKPEAEDGKPKADGERKKHKRERRKSTHSKSVDSEDGKPTKVRKKKVPKPELGVLKPESSLKRDEKMEDIFGPLSDDSENGHVKTSMTPNNGNSNRMFDKLSAKWQVSVVYGSDSDSNASLLGPRIECYPPSAAIMSRPIEKERKRRDKKKRDKKASSVDLAEAGRALEAKLLGSDEFSDQALPKTILPSNKIEKHEDSTPKEETGNNDADVFRFTDGDESLEAATALLLEKAKEKKKKRKKSKEEKQSRREHHHHHHHDKSKSSPERKLSITSSLEDSKPSPLLSPSLPSLEMPLSPTINKSGPNLNTGDALSLSPPHHDSVIAPVTTIASTTTKVIEKKKPDKFIPGFGTEIDDIIHETAVKSISEFEEPKPKVELLVKEETSNKTEQGLPKSDDDVLGNEEEKPRAVISQEETEDAVAALLGESFGADFTPSDCYVGEGNGSPHTTTHAGNEPALPTDEEEETRKAIEAIDMKPDTPQSESDLQIDTDTDGDPEPTYSGLRFSGDDQSPRTPDGIDFSRPPKTPDLPSSYYRQQQSTKHYEQDSSLAKQTLQSDQVSQSSPSITKQLSPPSESVDAPEIIKPVESHECEENQSVEVPSSSDSATLPEKPESDDQTKPEAETENIPLSSETAENNDEQQEEKSLIPKIHVTAENDEAEKQEAIAVSPCVAYECKDSDEIKEETQVTSPTSKLRDEDVEDENNTHLDDTHTDSEVKEEEITEESHSNPKIEEEQQATHVETSAPGMNPPLTPCQSPTLSKTSPDHSTSNEIETEPPNTAMKDVNVPVKEEDKTEDASRDFRPYQFENEVTSKEMQHSVQVGDAVYKSKDSDITTFKGTESGTNLDRNYISSAKEDSGFVSVIKEEHASDIARESDFSEPETDMKADNDFVANLLASDSMTQDDNSRPALETDADRSYSPFKEREIEVVSVIKEPEHGFKKEEEQDPFASPRPESPSKENYEALPSNKDNILDSKNDLSDEIKADSDFWSAKDVNIDSVIRKVDALCSGDEMSPQRDISENVNENDNKLWFDQFKEKSIELTVPEEVKKESEIVEQTPAKIQSVEVEVKEEEKSSEKDENEMKEKDPLITCEEQEKEDSFKSPPKELDSSVTLSISLESKEEPVMSASSPEREPMTSSPEEETQDRGTEVQSPVSGQTTPRSSGRGGRGGMRGKTQTRISGVTTRRSRLAGQKQVTENITTAPVSPRRGGRRSRGTGNKASLHDHSTSPANKKLTTDVYEFRDDSEDESSSNGEKGRPRLILTIKSPQASSGGKDVQVATKTAPAAVPVVETREEFPSPATRKSRRLQERDGSRSTVDDVIEDVVRSAGKVTRSATAAAAAAAAVTVTGTGLGLRPRRSTRQNMSTQRTALVVPEQPRKSPRGSKKQQTQQRRLSENHDESSEEKKKMDDETTVSKLHESSETDKEAEGCNKSPDSPGAAKKTNQSEKDDLDSSVVTKSANSHPGGDDDEPTTLIDPVTGLLIPMRESEEGQYIPVTTASIIIPTTTPQISTGSLSESQELPISIAEPDKARAQPHNLPTVPVTSASFQQPSTETPPVSAAQQTHVPVILNTVPKPVITTAITTQPTPVVGLVRSLALCKPVVQTSSTKTVPTTLKAHVLQQTTKIVPPQTVSTGSKVVQPVLQPPPPSGTSIVPSSVLPQSSAMKVHTIAQPVIKNQGIPTTATVAHPKTREGILHQSQSHSSPLSVSKSIQSTVPINPKAHLLQAVTGAKSSGGQTVVVAPGAPGQAQIPVVSKIHHISGPPPPQPQQIAVNMKATSTAAMTPKAHLLQAAAGGAPKTGPNFVPQQKASHSTLMNVGASKVPTSSPPQPPKAHHGPAQQQPILTGAVASPPLKAPHLSSQQPVVTGASSSRAAVPKSQIPSMASPHLAQHGKGLMDPPKVDVSLGGCIVVPTASPQPRNPAVLQAGMPVPAYEASIQHAGSGGVVAELLPNPQFVLAQRQQSPPPAHQQGEVVQHVSFPHHMRNPTHDSAQHYFHPQLMYHQYLRAHQEALTAHIPHYLPQGAVRSPMVPGLEVKSEPESEEARGSSPPLELRRPSSNGAVARGGSTVAHSLQSPHDRTTDSPQVATVYVHAASRLPHYNPPQQPPPRYYEPGAEPPPAHLRTPRHHHPLPGTEAPATQPRLQVATPPLASQVPPQADSLLMLLQRYPVMWQGLLALKNDQAAVQMHFVFGNPHVARESLPCNSDGSTPPLRIAQRMRLEQTQVEGVARKMQMDNEHCMLLALPCGRDHMDVLQQSNNLQTGFITYLQQKQAAGIVNIAAPGSQQAAYVVHIFPSCEFANENLARIAPDLLHRVADIAHLLIIIATV
ncbi:protein split ends-like isoform X5 [Periplaneta americana]|uniref:protein split ends-like isoform X5 n=1 Tax=Periplaneta americana TaxID=6978 RepID=UPI0037E9A3FF